MSDSDFVNEQWRGNAPNATKDFNEAAKEQAKKEVPTASDKGIATKAELDQRIRTETILREKMARDHKSQLKPKNDIAKKASEDQFKKNQEAYAENEKIKNKIRQQIEQKKKEELTREFNLRANPTKEFKR